MEAGGSFSTMLAILDCSFPLRSCMSTGLFPEKFPEQITRHPCQHCLYTVGSYNFAITIEHQEWLSSCRSVVGQLFAFLSLVCFCPFFAQSDSAEVAVLISHAISNFNETWLHTIRVQCEPGLETVLQIETQQYSSTSVVSVLFCGIISSIYCLFYQGSPNSLWLLTGSPKCSTCPNHLPELVFKPSHFQQLIAGIRCLNKFW